MFRGTQGYHESFTQIEKEKCTFSIVAYNPVFEVTFKDGVLYENGKAIDQDPFEYLDQVTVKGIKCGYRGVVLSGLQGMT